MSAPGLLPLIHLPQRPAGGPVVLIGPDASHIGGSLRMKPGDRLEAAFPGGDLVLIELTLVDRHRVEAIVIGTVDHDREPTHPIHLALGLLKTGKLDDLIPPLVELGVASIRLVEANRSIQRLDHGIAKKLDRWEKVAREAAMLGRRPHLPRIHEPAPLARALAEAAGTRVLLHERAPEAPVLSEAMAGIEGPVTLFIGPEGGWDDEEAAAAVASGAVVAQLGSRILRSQTAAVAALAVALAAAADL